MAVAPAAVSTGGMSSSTATWAGIAVVVLGLAATVVAYASRRRRPRPPAPTGATEIGARLDAFWSWWAGAAPRIAAAYDERRGKSVAAELGARVDAIDPRLAWETGPGLHGARHHLSLSSEGDPELRVLAERWLSRAPAPDATWEYYPARQATPGDPTVSLELGDAPGVVISYPDVRVALEDDALRERIHVQFHHPSLARLPEGARTRAAFLVLDGVLGEDGVERWVGGIETSTEPLPDGKPLGALAAAVASLARTATGERFATVEGRTESGEPMIVAANLAVKRVDHLLMEQHLEVILPFREQAARGMPTPEENAAAYALEDELRALLGHDAVWLAHETGEGRRTIHFHVSGQGPAEARARAWAREHADRRISIDARHDPGWEILRRWR